MPAQTGARPPELRSPAARGSACPGRALPAWSSGVGVLLGGPKHEETARENGSVQRRWGHAPVRGADRAAAWLRWSSASL
eukprot:3963807-Alexandrium_andersonii.AAC.1